MKEAKAKKNEFQQFDQAMHKLVQVSHDEIKAKLDAEKAGKSSKPKKVKNK
jgi:hypothetical protein